MIYFLRRQVNDDYVYFIRQPYSSSCKTFQEQEENNLSFFTDNIGIVCNDNKSVLSVIDAHKNVCSKMASDMYYKGIGFGGMLDVLHYLQDISHICSIDINDYELVGCDYASGKIINANVCDSNYMDNYCKHSLDIEKLLLLDYQSLVSLLLQTYGPVPYDYFATEECKSKRPKNSRTKDGLVIHHIDEDKHILLGEPAIARKLPFDYQRSDRLVYCNMVEHLLLHIKIAEERQDKHSGVGIGGCKLVYEQINAWIVNGRPNGWRGNLYDAINFDLLNESGLIYDKLGGYSRIMLYLFDLVWNDEVYSNPQESLFIHPLELTYTYESNQYCSDVSCILFWHKCDDIAFGDNKSRDEHSAVIDGCKGPYCDYEIYNVDDSHIEYRGVIYDDAFFITKAPRFYNDLWHIKRKK